METPKQLFDELTTLQQAIIEAGNAMPQKARDAANSRGDYELKKAKRLLSLFKEETDNNLKRTVDQRTAIYRSELSAERLQAYLAENEWKASADELRALQSALTALQTRSRISENEYKSGGYTT